MPKSPGSLTFVSSLGLSLSMGLSGLAHAKNNRGQRIPDEFESLGGHALGFANGGTAASSGLGSVRSNPAMLAVEKNYSVSAGYHWPSVGREFYQAGAVDGKTSNIAAGVVYTSSQNKYRQSSEFKKPDDQFQAFYDSPIKYRVAGGFAQNFANLSVGVSGQYIETEQARDELADNTELPPRLKGSTLGLGVAGLLTPSLRFGVSAENITNKSVSHVAPKTYRAGLAYTLFSGDFTVHLDYSQRDRVELEKRLAPGQLQLSSDSEMIEIEKAERLLNFSGSVRVQDLFRCLVAYGQEISGARRQLWGAGLAVVNQNLSLSYMVSQPYLADPSKHQAINVSMQVAI